MTQLFRPIRQATTPIWQFKMLPKCPQQTAPPQPRITAGIITMAAITMVVSKPEHPPLAVITAVTIRAAWMQEECRAVTMAGSTPAEWPADFMAAGIIESQSHD